MKTRALLAALFAATAVAAEPTGFEIKVTGVPADATEVIGLVDTFVPPPPSYDDPPPAPAAQPAVLIDPAAPPAAQPQRRRRGGFGRAAAAPPPPATRVAVATNGTSSVSLSVPTATGDKFQIRVVAVKGTNTAPVVLAGGRVAQAKAAPGKITAVDLALAVPQLKLSAENPATVAPGASYTLAGTITDAANCLGTKNRMRVWMTPGAAPRVNFTGAQISTIDVTTEGNDVKFSFTLTAPKEPGPLYFQFGELPTEFARADGKEAPLLVLPDVSAGAAALSIRVL